MVFGSGRNLNHLSAQLGNQSGVFGFRVADDDVVLRHQEGIGDLPLGRKGLTGTGGAQNQAVGIFQQLPVNHDQVVAESVQAIVERLPAALKQLLGGKGDEDANAGAGEPPLNLNLVVPQGQAAHEPLLLLVVQGRDVAVVFLGDGFHLEHIVFQLPLGVGGAEDQEGHQKHPLVPAL